MNFDNFSCLERQLYEPHVLIGYPGQSKIVPILEVKYWTDHDLLNFVPSAINLGVTEHSKTRDDDWQVAHAFKHVHQGWS